MMNNDGYSGMDWISMVSKYTSTCQACGFKIQKFEPIYWNKITKSVRHRKCLDLEFYKTFGQKHYWKGDRY